MLFTWDTTNLCIVFRQWHIRSTASLMFSLIAVVILSIGYEGLRSLSRRYEVAVSKRIEALPSEYTRTPPPPDCPRPNIGNVHPTYALRYTGYACYVACISRGNARLNFVLSACAKANLLPLHSRR